MSSAHRKILPAQVLPSPATSGTPDTPLAKRKRVGVKVACASCRARKISCSGHRPTCASCLKRKFVCVYDTKHADETRHTAMTRELSELQAELQDHRDILERLRAAPNDETFAIVQSLKSSADIGAILDSLKSPLSSQSPSSEVEVARAVLPPTSSDAEFELSILHEKVYVLVPDVDPFLIDIASIFAPRARCQVPYASTKALVETFSKQRTNTQTQAVVGSLTYGPPSPLQSTDYRIETSLSGPLPHRVYCDARLRHMKFGYWTRVPLSDEYAASILSAYFENEHAIVGTFDIDTFFDDLTDGRQDYCSAFLVSSVLGLASLFFSSLDPRALPLASAFLAEAKTLWKAERSTNSIANLSAIMTLAVLTMVNGDEAVSLDAFADGRQMAERMSLIGLRHDQSLYTLFERMSHKKARAFAQAAWGCYSWLTIHATFFGGEPIAFPPVFPIPGAETQDSQGVWTAPRHDYLGNTFTEWCRLWTISQEIQALCHQKDGTRSLNTPLAAVESKYRKLLAWAGSLGEGMTRRHQKFPHVSVLHAYFHIIILDLFRPYLDSSEPMQLSTTSSHDSSPEVVFNASMKQLQRILLDYTSRYDPRFYNFTLNGAILHMLHQTFQRGDVVGGRVNLNLGMAWMKEIYARFAVIGKVAQAYMAIGMGTGMLSAAEARDFMEELQKRGRHHDLAKVVTSCIVDFEVAMSSSDDCRAQDLARRFDELALFNETVTGDWQHE